MRDPVPTVTIGGFLGAGKTTLVNHLLCQAKGQRVVVFVNDFGAINIDHDLIDTVEEDRIALSNGCVCCSLNGDLVRTMVEFCEGDRPDLFAIEASGVADPKALTSTLQALHAAGQATLSARLYVLDAAHFGGLDYADTEDLIDHAAASDLIVINKADLVSPDLVEEITQVLDRSAPRVARKITAQAQVGWDEALAERSDPQSVPRSGAAGAPARHADFTTVSYDNVAPLSASDLTALVDLMKETCLRAKGFLLLEGTAETGRRLQLVGRNVELTSVTRAQASPARLVVIGWSKSLPVQELSRLLKAQPCA